MMPTRRSMMVHLGSFAVTVSAGTSTHARQLGKYRGRIVAEWLPTREMKLTEPFEYIASDGLRWPVPVGAVIDGASIPQFLWSIIGGPFEGAYREASVVHDYFCDTRTRSSRAVHQMFHEAMLTSGVTEPRSWLMFQGVDQFGPRWPDPNLPTECQIYDADRKVCPRRLAKPSVTREAIDRTKLEAFIKQAEGRASAADIEKLTQLARSM